MALPANSSTSGSSLLSESELPAGISYAEAMEGNTRPLLHPDNPVVFLDIAIGSHEVGRIKIELFKNIAPKSAENFRQFCTGEFRQNQVPIGYKGVSFHRIIKDFMIQGGDFVKGDGTGCLSIYGSSFADEAFVLPHFRSGLLSLANSGPNTNGCQFFITCTKCDWLNKKHVVFGQVLGKDSMQVVRKIEHVTVDSNNRPRVPVTVTQCGEL
ncbi:U-snRNP-associated cyclophilin family protein [Besnoitia besnoiti]|uniref:Peptidyl-prolyl cis-trans isomerase n=1 Tax=Besnoitia besnoiti TaxID=94643 RepID=A0A2A9MGR7_BESBE|nr:U-snRNP-associated cyclophilin family protein [Besnoitia besnoiti]PFH34853.1 U-snRNP-associated cyclophilin family protein [Besnoitia besnoiti]